MKNALLVVQQRIIRCVLTALSNILNDNGLSFKKFEVCNIKLIQLWTVVSGLNFGLNLVSKKQNLKDGFTGRMFFLMPNQQHQLR